MDCIKKFFKEYSYDGGYTDLIKFKGLIKCNFSSVDINERRVELGNKEGQLELITSSDSSIIFSAFNRVKLKYGTINRLFHISCIEEDVLYPGDDFIPKVHIYLVPDLEAKEGYEIELDLK